MLWLKLLSCLKHSRFYVTSAVADVWQTDLFKSFEVFFPAHLCTAFTAITSCVFWDVVDAIILTFYFVFQGYVFVLLNDLATAANGVVTKQKLESKDLGTKYYIIFIILIYF